MKVFFVLKHLFLAVGIALLIGAIFVYKSSSDFLLSAVATRGTIIGLVPRKHDDSVSYHPVVSFITEGGRSVEFTSHQEGNASGYPIGSSVGVLYSPPQADKAKIKGFFAIWGPTLLLAVLGAVFVSVGTAALLLAVGDARKKPWLAQSSLLKSMKSGC